MSKDYNKIAAFEFQISQKYGEKTVAHPRADWDDEDEEIFEEERAKMYKKHDMLDTKKEYSDKRGYLASKKLFNDSKVDSCLNCGKYKIHFTVLDDINIARFACCNDCYIKYVDGREDRWLSGWRPETT